MAHFWKPFTMTCRVCNHRNMPHKSPRIGIRMVLTGEFKTCRKCKTPFLLRLSNRPLTRQIRAELIAEGIMPVC